LIESCLNDKKSPLKNRSNINAISVSEYSPFGVELTGRSWSVEEYRSGFNGKEKDDEIKGKENSYDYGFRIYDTRLGRFLSVDPLTKKFPFYTPFQFAGNIPIAAIDLDGLEDYIVVHWTSNDKLVGTTLYKISSNYKIDPNNHDVVYKTMDVSQRMGTSKNGSADLFARLRNNENPSARNNFSKLISDRREWKQDFEHDEEQMLNGGLHRYAALTNQTKMVAEFVRGVFILDIPELIPSNVSFKTGSADLTDDGKKELDMLFMKMTLVGDMKINLVGYTDDVGENTANMTLSKNRASSAMQYLVGKGIEASRLSAEGRGESNPVAPNSSEEGKAKNRRIKYERP
jgi:RHS repeat-associated protein